MQGDVSSNDFASYLREEAEKVVPAIPKVVQLRRPTADLAAYLRGMAERAERGELTDFVAVTLEGPLGEPDFHWSASSWDAVVMTAMLAESALGRLRNGGG
jgi:hypothetical protein